MIQVRNVSKSYPHAREPVLALDGVDLQVDEGDFVVIHGASGSGKTTLLLTLGGMLRPTSGSVVFRDSDLYSLSVRRRSQYRRRCVGFIFQKFFLVPYLTALDNIRMALAVRGYRG